MERLDKILSNSGIGTRKEVKALIKQGNVMVNDTVVDDPGVHVDPSVDAIYVNGIKLVYRKYIYLMHNKKMGYITATEDDRERTVLDLLPEEYRHFKVFPVGRLDKDSEGLLLLTNDGDLAHRLLSPNKKVEKKYYVRVAGGLGDNEVEKFRKGIKLDDGYVTLPAELEILKRGDISEAYVTIVEGKFHQVKRMFLALSKKVEYLKRVSMGPLLLDENLKPGHFRELTEEEIFKLKSAVKN
ncbi:16S rRNA pseudouridine516 synthase [Caldanaerobius fijiensis DSM 17918]|uniref:Pseudouridine synthase n=1 Tax=Caldanaerobius fijiensis DSM 17918 TaxID=1121256 RepID=A0A1M4XXV9_9THEO|nr:pseudouridine synthase [Caldanaerobius fijiensis]SHE98268.1 16S rRNA pseudouridine516 synthase [Caldanaerobius fijiensis DSM 17918]